MPRIENLHDPTVCWGNVKNWHQRDCKAV